MGYTTTFPSNIHLPPVNHFRVVIIDVDYQNKKHNRCKYIKSIKTCVLKTWIRQFLKLSCDLTVKTCVKNNNLKTCRNI